MLEVFFYIAVSAGALAAKIVIARYNDGGVFAICELDTIKSIESAFQSIGFDTVNVFLSARGTCWNLR